MLSSNLSSQFLFCKQRENILSVKTSQCRVYSRRHDTVRFSRSRLSKVDDCGTNRKRICDFLLVINSNCPILHRFWDTATYWLKTAYFSYPSLIWRPRSLCSLWNFALKLTMHEELRVMGLCSSEDCMIIAWVILTQCQRVTDGQTDGQTVGFTIASTALCIASYADAL